MPDSDIFQLQGSVVLLTGAAGGVGRATARLLLDRGAQLVVEDRNPEVEDLAKDHPDRVRALVGDVADEQVAERAVQTAVEAFGGLDVLVNNAGRTLNKPFTETTVEDFDGLNQTNSRGAFVHMRAALRVMLAANRGSIVNVASLASTVAMPLLAAYASSKGSVAQLTRVGALETAAHGIRVNAIAAGIIDTGILDDVAPDGRASLRESGRATPIGRAAQPEEIAEAIVWVASPLASYLTGAVVPVDGGYTAA